MACKTEMIAYQIMNSDRISPAYSTIEGDLLKGNNSINYSGMNPYILKDAKPEDMFNPVKDRYNSAKIIGYDINPKDNYNPKNKNMDSLLYYRN